MASTNPQTQHITTSPGVTLAYRLLPCRSPSPSHPSSPPLVLLMHFRGTMHHWDPLLLTQLSAHRPLLVLDNAGIGASTGQVPPSFAGWADHVLELLVALKLELVDVLGFSMGGCVAQLVALRAPRAGVRVRRLVLAGTTASAGPGIKLLTSEEELAPFMRLRGAESEDEQRAAFLECFFLPGEEGRREGEKVWERVCRGREAGRGDGLAEYAGQEAAKRQAVAYARFMDLRRRGEGSFDWLAELTMPVLVANGSNDVLIPTHNSYVIWQNLQNSRAQLQLFPASGHGFLYQYAERFARLVNEFLDAEEEWEEKGGRGCRL
ncbi:Alpha/Beta hydrolase protein [Phyllosticta capitalensis]|uniref:Alpha/Beta hydrolase protein n=1 Tax=Phyllosticta capitalensis TaxID=121624 RepID=A0ABR1YDQ0_9PEZI